jgi:hypothetical protein
MPGQVKTRTYTLRRASSVIFALISVLPLLLFVYTLYALGALHQHIAQIGLGSALVLSMVGFYIYSVMMSRLADILLDVEVGASALLSGAPHEPVVTMAVEPGPGGPLAAGQATGESRQAPGARSGRFSRRSAKGRSGAARGVGLVVPGIGRIAQIKPGTARALSDLDSMWRAEAEPLFGKRVFVVVRNASDPIKGILAQVTQDGVIIDQDGVQTGISYTRVSAIERDAAAYPA